MFALAVLLAQTFSFQTVASAQPKQALENIQVERVYTLAGPKNCKDPQAPCTAEVFSSSVATKALNGTASYTCGVQYKNALGTVVAKLSETVSLSWTEYGLTINSAYLSIWVRNSSYNWKNLSGPSPSSGSYARQFGLSVKTTGSIYYLGGLWDNATVRLSFTGIGPDEPNWRCYDY